MSVVRVFLNFWQCISIHFSVLTPMCLRRRTSWQTTKQEFWRTRPKWFYSSIWLMRAWKEETRFWSLGKSSALLYIALHTNLALSSSGKRWDDFASHLINLIYSKLSEHFANCWNYYFNPPTSVLFWFESVSLSFGVRPWKKKKTGMLFEATENEVFFNPLEPYLFPAKHTHFPYALSHICPVYSSVKACPRCQLLRTSYQRDPCPQASPLLTPRTKTGFATSITTVSHPICAILLL